MHDEDEHLIAAYLDGEAAAAETIRSWVVTALGSFRRRLGADLEDAVQEALLEITRVLGEGRFRGESRLRTYVWRLATSRAIDHLRRAARRHLVAVDDLEIESTNPSSLHRTLRREAVLIGLKVAAAMSEACRELWRMIVAGLSYRQMAELVAADEGALRVRVLRCRRRAIAFRESLEESARNNRPDATPDQ